MSKTNRFLVVALFVAAMAWVESAVVLYLRVMIDRIQPHQPDPLPVFAGLGEAELVREAATLIMLLCIGWLAGAQRPQRLGFAMLAFGAWDLLYYVFLVPLSGWPTSLLDWDILFLIPLPWWGPVLAPASIALLMVVTGSLIAGFDLWPRFPAWLASACGAALALYAFMADALRALPSGLHAVREVLPIEFNWPVFLLGWALMALPAADMLWQFLPLRWRQEPHRNRDNSLLDLS
jgi:hypothetical protein